MTSPVPFSALTNAPDWALGQAVSEIPFDEKFTGPSNYQDWQKAVVARGEELAKKGPPEERTPEELAMKASAKPRIQMQPAEFAPGPGPGPAGVSLSSRFSHHPGPILKG